MNKTILWVGIFIFAGIFFYQKDSANAETQAKKPQVICAYQKGMSNPIDDINKKINSDTNIKTVSGPTIMNANQFTVCVTVYY